MAEICIIGHDLGLIDAAIVKLQVMDESVLNMVFLMEFDPFAYQTDTIDPMTMEIDLYDVNYHEMDYIDPSKLEIVFYGMIHGEIFGDDLCNTCILQTDNETSFYISKSDETLSITNPNNVLRCVSVECMKTLFERCTMIALVIDTQEQPYAEALVMSKTIIKLLQTAANNYSRAIVTNFENKCGFEKAFIFDVICKTYIATNAGLIGDDTIPLCSDVTDAVIHETNMLGEGVVPGKENNNSNTNNNSNDNNSISSDSKMDLSMIYNQDTYDGEVMVYSFANNNDGETQLIN